MKIKWTFLSSLIVTLIMLAGCEPLKVLDPKGPQAETTTNVIWISIATMAIIVIAVFSLLVFVVFKYRASKQPDDYEPPHIEGSKWIESIIVAIPVIIIVFLSIVTVKSTYQVEATPEGYEEQEPLIIYASSSNWKWHFSYPEENIETVNYLYIPTNRAIEFKLYSYGPITSFWIPQLGGQKYAMSDMVTTLHLAADEPGEYMGRNANFSGEGFAENVFQVKAMPAKKFDEWVDDVLKTAKPITEEKFDELLKPGHLGQMTFSGTHLTFLPPPEGHHGGHQHGSDITQEGNKNNTDDAEQHHHE